MYKPVLSLDVSKENSIAALYLSFGEPMGKPFRVEHTPPGFAALVKQLKNPELLTHKKPEVILESTGNYSRAITQYLMEAGYSVIALNPPETHEQKRRAVRKVKTDKVDAQRIAKLYYFDKHKPLHPVNPEIAELRNLCRLYDGLSNLYIEAQLRFQSILDLLFPRYTDVFSDLCGDSSLNLISVFPTPEAVLSASKEDIVKHLKSKCQRKDWPEQIYQKLLAAARASLPFKVAQQSNVTTAKQLVAFAGLDPSVCQSGRFEADKNKLSKRGSGYLRKALCQAASAGVRVTGKGPVNPLLHDYYSRKVAEGKKKMVALLATSSKLLRIIYGVWRKNEPFKLS